MTTIFVLMLENRSFDHVFGYSDIVGQDVSKGVSGLPATTIDGLLGKYPPFTNPNPLGNPVPTSPTADYRIPAPAYDPYMKGADPPHEFNDVLQQLTGPTDKIYPVKTVATGWPKEWQGEHIAPPLTDHKYPPILDANDRGFVANYLGTYPRGPADVPMRCFDPDDLPILNALAREYVLCDNWFASMPGPTWSNRVWVHGASPTTERFAEDPSLDRKKQAASSLAGRKGPLRFKNGTIWHRLKDDRLRQDQRFGWLVWAGPSSACAIGNGIDGDHWRISLRVWATAVNPYERTGLLPRLKDPNWRPRYVFIEPDYGSQGGVAAGLNPCHEKHPSENDGHPPGDIRPAEQFLRQIYEAIRNSHLWKTSALIVTFDEHGGLFDHVKPPPGVNPADGPPDPHTGFNFDQLGVRVPCLVISPWVKKHGIDHTLYDHTSVIATTTRNFHLPALTQRDARANDLLHLFSNPRPRTDTPSSLQALDVHAVAPTKELTWVGDFTGLGRDELLFFSSATHDWWVGHRDPASGPDRVDRMVWARYPQVGGHRFDVSDTGKFAVHVGRFGGGQLDVLVYAFQTGQWWLGRLGGGTLTWTQVAKTPVPLPLLPRQPVYVGRFSSARAAAEEVLYYQLNGGVWWLGRLRGKTLSFNKVKVASSVGNLAAAQSWTGDFRRDGYDTLLVYQPAVRGAGKWSLLDVSRARLERLAPPRNTPKELFNLAACPAWLGDFQGLGGQQLLVYAPSTGRWWLVLFAVPPQAEAGGAASDSFNVVELSASAPNHATKALSWSGNFSGTGRTELMLYDNVLFRWTRGQVPGNTRQIVFRVVAHTQGFGDTSRLPHWSLRLTGARATQMLFFQRSSGHWWQGSIADDRLKFTVARNKAALTSPKPPPTELAPTVVVDGAADQYVFWRGRDGNLWQAIKEGISDWTGPIGLGMGPLGTQPAAGIDAKGFFYVYWKGTDGELWRCYRTGETIVGPEKVPGMGALGSAPTVAVGNGGDQYVFWKGEDGNLWLALQRAGSWVGPSNLGVGPIGTQPAAGIDAKGFFYVYWKGTDGELWRCYRIDETIVGPEKVRDMGALGSAPTVAVGNGGDQYVFWKGEDGNLRQALQGVDGWTGPTNLGMGPLGSPPAAGIDANGATYVYWKGQDAQLWRGYRNGATWVGPEQIPAMGPLG